MLLFAIAGLYGGTGRVAHVVSHCFLISVPYCFAKQIDQAHLLDGATTDVGQCGLGDQQGQAAGAGDSDIESVLALQKLDVARHAVAVGGGQSFVSRSIRSSAVRCWQP